jgi:hypothetical protein
MDDIFDTHHASHTDGERQGRSHDHELQCLPFCPVCRTADVVRVALPPEFQEHWNALQREGLLAARALLDYYIGHLEAQRRGPTMPIEDIPIE